MNRLVQLILIVYGYEGLILNLVPPSIFRIALEMIILVSALFIMNTSVKSSIRFNRYWTLLLLAVILVTICSGLFNSSSVWSTVSFLRYFILFFLGFILGSQVKKSWYFKSILATIIVSQPLAAIIKLILIGPSEDYIGTISISAGSLATTFTLLVIGYLFIEYRISGKFHWLLGILIFSVVAYAGDKRVYWFIAPLSIFVLDSIIRRTRLKFSQIIILVLSLSTSIYVGARMLPSLNSSHKFWGEWDSEYLSDYVLSYTNGSSDEGLGVGRIGSQIAMYENLNSGANIRKYFGTGPDTFIDKSNVDGVQKEFGVYLLSHFTGVMFYMGSIGFIGSILYLLFLCSSLRLSLKLRYVNDRISLFLTHTYIVMIWDYLFYTKSLQNYQGIIFFSSLLLGYLVSKKYAYTVR